MPLFHATTSILELNQPKTAPIRTLTRIQARIDREFDQLKPAAAISRSGALFAGDDPVFCAAYLVSERGTAETPINVYRVQMVNPSLHHPMYLVSYARHFLEKLEVLTNIISEYWMPTQSWKCWEYLAASMTPVAMEPTPDGQTKHGVVAQYSHDATLALKLWPKP
ncbi:MAG: hypothetical protein ABSC03_08305 [Verrucomicrobiota bacterium]|jgi:hypothetical protein